MLRAAADGSVFDSGNDRSRFKSRCGSIPGKGAKQDGTETARGDIHGIIGEERMVEENDRFLAYPTINKAAVYKCGAEKRT